MRTSARLLGVFAAVVLGWTDRVCAAPSSLEDGGFEEDIRDYWQLNYGGEGGGTSGAAVSTNLASAHSGKHSLILSVEPLPRARSHAWASVSQQAACSAGEHLTIQLWLRRESATASTNAAAQGIIEYFEDREYRQPICQHLRMTSNLSIAGLPREKWTKVELADTVPGGATMMRVSILLIASGPSAGRQEIAVDDVKLAVTRPAAVREKK